MVKTDVLVTPGPGPPAPSPSFPSLSCAVRTCGTVAAPTLLTGPIHLLAPILPWFFIIISLIPKIPLPHNTSSARPYVCPQCNFSTHSDESFIPVEPRGAPFSWTLVGMRALRSTGTSNDSLWLALVVFTLYLQTPLSSVYCELPRQCDTGRIIAHLPTCSSPGGRQVLEDRLLLEESLTCSTKEKTSCVGKGECGGPVSLRGRV